MEELMTRRNMITKAVKVTLMTGAGIGTIDLMGCSDGNNASSADYRNQCMGNVLRMGHCAPSIMKTILEMSEMNADWPVKLVAGLPGGIGNTGYECGGVTSPVFMLGLRYGYDALHRGLPCVIDKGHEYLRRFRSRHGTHFCRDIRGNGMMACVGAMRHSPGMYAETVSHDGNESIPAARRDSYKILYEHFKHNNFHCSSAVFNGLRDSIRVSSEVLSGTCGFIGGTLFTGMTCSAFTAGVMAIGAALGTIENSRLRVLRMIALMMIGSDDAMADDKNEFNRIINIGHRMSEWFHGEFGSTQCREITRCDFSTSDGVGTYMRSNRIARCREISASVSQKTREILGEEEA